MKRSRFSEEQIIGVLEEAEATSVKGVDKSCMKCRYTTYACEITMTKEQEIIANCACLKVRMAARAVTRAYDAALRPVGLRATQLSVLVAVAIDGAISIAALADFLGMDRTTLTRNLRPLEKEGLIFVGPEGWRRSRILEITSKGQSRLREALPLWENAQNALRQKLGYQAWLSVRNGLDQLIQTA
jgi:DNA-binding MarR family transcriptional regulator